MKFAICNEIFQGWPLERTLEYVARAGYDAVELAPFTLAKSVADISATERARIRALADRAGLAIAGIHWVLVQTEGLYLTHPEAATRARTADYFGALVDFCADLGGRVIVVGSPKHRDVLAGVSPAEAWAHATEVFRAPVRRAEERGVTICFEPLAPSETNFVNAAADAIQFVKQFQSPAMKIILDVKAMSAEAKPIPQIIHESRGEFAHFHANDPNLKGPGFGEVDFQPIAAALRATGYDGFVSVEVFRFEEGPEVIATQSLEYLKRVFG